MESPLHPPSAASRRAVLRGLLAQDRLTVAPGVYDPLTALLVERLGFAALYLGGNALGLHLGCGQPFITLTETAECTRRVSSVSNLPVVTDAGAGFGDPANVYRTIRELDFAGATAIHIDDQPSPKRAHYHVGAGRVTSTSEFTDKIQAAVEGRANSDIVLIGRTDALRVQPVKDVLDRCTRMVDAGVDMLMVVDLQPNYAELFVKRFSETPLVWIGGHKVPTPSVSEIEGAGFRLALYPFNTVACVAANVRELWSNFGHCGVPTHAEGSLDHLRIDLQEVIGLGPYLDIEDRTSESDCTLPHSIRSGDQPGID